MSYGVNKPCGLMPLRYLNGSPWNGAQNPYPIASGYVTAIYLYDPVITLNDGTIGIGVAGSPCRGVFLGCQFTDTSGTLQNLPYWPAAQAVFQTANATAFILDDPNVVLTMQETNGSGAAGTPLALADVGLNINFAVAAGAAPDYISGTSINNTTENTTPTLNMKILGLTASPGNVVGNFANWDVTWNTHQLKSVGTDGV
jgi:hypothetical protein